MAKLIVSFFDQFPEYNGHRIEIRGKDGYFCASDMSLILEKTFTDWRRTKFATRLINRLSERLNIPIDRQNLGTHKLVPNLIPLIDYVPGRGQKVWVHPALAMSYAMSNPEFQADINVWIWEMMNFGTVNPHVLKWTQEEIERGIQFNQDDIKELYGDAD
jgi:hypothetical protein